MVVGRAGRSEQLRIVDGSTPEDVTWARALVSRQWRHGGAPGHGGWGRLAEVTQAATVRRPLESPFHIPQSYLSIPKKEKKKQKNLRPSLTMAFERRFRGVEPCSAQAELGTQAPLRSRSLTS